MHVNPTTHGEGQNGPGTQPPVPAPGHRHPFPNRVTWSPQVDRGRCSRGACWRGQASPGWTSCRGVAARTGTQANCQDRLRGARQCRDWRGRPGLTHAVTITHNCRPPPGQTRCVSFRITNRPPPASGPGKANQYSQPNASQVWAEAGVVSDIPLNSQS